MSKVLSDGELVIDLALCQVTLKGRPVSLTPTEFWLLAFMARNPHQVFGRDVILDRVWPYYLDASEDNVKWYIWSLRRKLKAVSSHKYIINRYGFGYIFVPLSPAASFHPNGPAGGSRTK